MRAQPRLLKWRTVATLVPLAGMLVLFRTAYRHTPIGDRGILTGGMLAFVAMGALLVALDAADSIRQAPKSEADFDRPPPLDAVWDALDAGAVGLGVSGVTGPRFSDLAESPSYEGFSSAGGDAGVFVRTRAMPVETERLGDVGAALERAAIAVGCPAVPSVWSIQAPGAVNAFIAHGPANVGVAATQEMLDTFSTDELMAVFANLLSRSVRIADGADRSNDRLPAPIGQQFADAIRAYADSDRRALLAMRDSGPLVSALLKTRQRDPFVPGATVFDSLAAWTWVGPPPADLPTDPLEMLALATRETFGGDVELRQRAETLRLAELEKVAAIDPSIMPSTDGPAASAGLSRASLPRGPSREA